jgi:hypothetical protein
MIRRRQKNVDDHSVERGGLGIPPDELVGNRAAEPTAPTFGRLVADGTDLATAMLDVPSQLVKGLEYVGARRRDHRYECSMLVYNWR